MIVNFLNIPIWIICAVWKLQVGELLFTLHVLG